MKQKKLLRRTRLLELYWKIDPQRPRDDDSAPGTPGNDGAELLRDTREAVRLLIEELIQP